MTKKMTFEEVKFALKEYLPIFLEEEGFSSKKKNMFHSFYPDTEDKNPSLHVFKTFDGSTIYHDFSTNRSGDIFIANHIINGAPITGYEFITDNVKVLADKYGLQFNIKPLSEEQITIMNIKTLNNLVKNIIVNNLLYKDIDEKVKEYIELKDISIEDIKSYNIGYVDNWYDFKNELVSMGYTDEMLKEYGIQKYLFNSNNLIFSILNKNKQTIGFGARNCYYKIENNSGSKYYNTSENIVYNKKSVLYNIDKATSKFVGKYSSLYIVEGYTDSIMLDKMGLRAVGLSSTAFTHNHISMLQEMGETDIVFMLDGDDAGIKNTGRIITDIMEGIRSFRVRIMTIPNEMDPDEYIRMYGIKSLLDLKHETTFEWKIKQLQDKTDLDNYEMAMQVIPLIVNESSNIEKDRMCKHLSEITDIPISTIRKEVDKIDNDNEIKLNEERNTILDTIIRNLKTNPNEAEIILSNAIGQIKSITDRNKSNIYSVSEYVNEINNIKMQEENDTDEDLLNYYRMPMWEEKMKGGTARKLLLLGGQPNSGKTAFLCTWAVNVLKAGDECLGYGELEDPSRRNNVSILIHSVDDARREILPRIIAILASEYYRNIFINAISKPHKYNYSNKQAMLNARKKAYETIVSWAKEGRLIIKDANMGTSLVNSHYALQMLRDKYPDRHIIFILDNMYNLNDFGNFENETKRVAERVTMLKNEILVKDDIMGFATVEYRKGKGDSNMSYQAQNEMIKDSKTLEYRANWVGHLFNDLHSSESSKLYFWDPSIPLEKRTKNNRSPIIQLSVSKNKITEHKIRQYYYFLPSKSLHLEITANELGHMNADLQSILRPQYYRADEEIRIHGESILETCLGSKKL